MVFHKLTPLPAGLKIKKCPPGKAQTERLEFIPDAFSPPALEDLPDRAEDCTGVFDRGCRRAYVPAD